MIPSHRVYRNLSRTDSKYVHGGLIDQHLTVMLVLQPVAPLLVQQKQRDLTGI